MKPVNFENFRAESDGVDAIYSPKSIAILGVSPEEKAFQGKLPSVRAAKEKADESRQADVGLEQAPAPARHRRIF